MSSFVVDGYWAGWGSWQTCSVTCGGGTQIRERTCTNPAPQHGGAICVGLGSSDQDCNTQVCISEYQISIWVSSRLELAYVPLIETNPFPEFSGYALQTSLGTFSILLNLHRCKCRRYVFFSE